jgi:ribosomal protein L12E/L44/L45/RPP1/RPP2
VTKARNIQRKGKIDEREREEEEEEESREKSGGGIFEDCWRDRKKN